MPLLARKSPKPVFGANVHLPVDTLVQLKALDVTPEYVRSLQSHGLTPGSADELVKLKAVGLSTDER